MSRSRLISDDDVLAFGQSVKRRRLELGLSQNEVCRRLGFEDYAGFISRLESGQREPGVLIAERIAKVLDTTVDELLRLTHN